MKNRKIDSIYTFCQIILLFVFLFAMIVRFIDPALNPFFNIFGILFFLSLLIDKKTREINMYNPIVYAFAMMYFLIGLLSG